MFLNKIFQLNIVAASEDSPLAIKLKKTWLRTPVGEEQAAQAVLDPSIGIVE